MNSADAKQILIACRPGTDDLREPAARAALELAGRDPELQQWWQEQQAFQETMRERFRSVPVPGHLRERILSRSKIIAPSWWRRPVAWSAAAALALLIAGAAFWQKSSEERSFPTFRSRMVGNVLRQYSMTVTTDRVPEIREHLEATNAPADFVLPENLAQLPALGAGVLSWQDRRVSMVCLDSKTHGTLFLFVVDAASVKDAPRQSEYLPVKSLMTVSWTDGDKVYVLAGNGTKEWLRGLR